jgi:TPR repeat protein
MSPHRLLFIMALASLGCDRMVNRLGREDSRACDLGLMDSCIRAAGHVPNLPGGARAPGAAPFLRRACELGSMPACTDYGAMLYNATGASRDRARAHELFRRACDARVKEACRNVGLYYEEERHENASAIRYYGMACALDDARGCRFAGDLLDASDPAAARVKYARSCALGDELGCGQEGVSRVVVDGVAGHHEGLPLLRRGCAAGHRMSCYNLGVIERDGEGGPNGPRDVPAARGHFATACEAGVAFGCSNLGALLFDGADGVPRDREASVRAFRRGCELGGARACGALGAELLAGVNLPANPAEADTLLTRACTLESWDHCDLLGTAAIDGRLPGGEARGASLRARACAHGVTAACGAPTRDGEARGHHGRHGRRHRRE